MWRRFAYSPLKEIPMRQLERSKKAVTNCFGYGGHDFLETLSGIAGSPRARSAVKRITVRAIRRHGRVTCRVAMVRV